MPMLTGFHSYLHKIYDPGTSTDKDVALVLGVSVLPVSSEQIKTAVRKDPLLLQVMRYTA